MESNEFKESLDQALEFSKAIGQAIKSVDSITSKNIYVLIAALENISEALREQLNLYPENIRNAFLELIPLVKMFSPISVIAVKSPRKENNNED